MFSQSLSDFPDSSPDLFYGQGLNLATTFDRRGGQQLDVEWLPEVLKSTACAFTPTIVNKEVKVLQPTIVNYIVEQVALSAEVEIWPGSPEVLKSTACDFTPTVVNKEVKMLQPTLVSQVIEHVGFAAEVEVWPGTSGLPDPQCAERGAKFEFVKGRKLSFSEVRGELDIPTPLEISIKAPRKLRRAKALRSLANLGLGLKKKVKLPAGKENEEN